MILALLGITTGVSAERYKYDVISPADLIAGDYITDPVAGDPTDNSTPWYEKGSISRTAVVVGNVAGNTATAVVFHWVVPDDFNGKADLFAVVEPDASDTTVKLKADVQKQSATIGSSPAIVTSVTEGTASAALGANADGELNWLTLPNSAIRGLTDDDRRKQIGVYVGRSAGTGEDLRIYNFYIRYEFKNPEHLPNE